MTRFQRLRAHITYANVAATIALVAALGTGGAYAASQFKVGKHQLRKGAVTSRAIKNNTVAGRDLSGLVRRKLNSTDRADVSPSGEAVYGTATNVSFAAPNLYTVDFGSDQNLSRCTFVATLGIVNGSDDPPAGGTADASSSGFGKVVVRTWDATGNPVQSGFNLAALC